MCVCVINFLKMISINQSERDMFELPFVELPDITSELHIEESSVVDFRKSICYGCLSQNFGSLMKFILSHVKF